MSGPKGQRGGGTHPGGRLSGGDRSNQINVVSLQADDPGGLLHVSGWDDRLHSHPGPGTPLGGLHHRWSPGVNHPSVMYSSAFHLLPVGY